jgi:hypothetical protein
MEARIRFSSNTSITALNADGEKLINALKVFINKLPAEDIVKLSEAIEKKPELVKQALKYKHFII